MKEKVDCIVVGQGIAGSVLALELLARGQRIKVIDDNHYRSSSLIAGGLVHPMSFRRTILSWRAEELSKFSIEYYKRKERELGASFFEPLTFVRLFGSIEEQNTWYARRAEKPFDEVLQSFDEDWELYDVKNDFGAGRVEWSYRLHLDVFLRSVREYLESRGGVLNEKFEYEKLELKEESVVYKGIEANKIIFCEGFQYIYNPFFDYLPKNLTKGEILVVQTQKLPDYVLSKNVFLLPLLSGNRILGATYDWDSMDLIPTQKAKDELLEKFAKISNQSPEIVEHRVGVRPTTRDRKPWLGQHPIEKNVFIFNGLGSKGVQLAPFFANKMVNYLLKADNLDKEVDVNRLTNKFFDHKVNKKR